VGDDHDGVLVGVVGLVAMLVAVDARGVVVSVSDDPRGPTGKTGVRRPR